MFDSSFGGNTDQTSQCRQGICRVSCPWCKLYLDQPEVNEQRAFKNIMTDLDNCHHWDYSDHSIDNFGRAGQSKTHCSIPILIITDSRIILPLILTPSSDLYAIEYHF